MEPCLYITDVGAPDKAVLQKLIPSSPKEVQVKIARAHTLIDKWRYFLSDLLVRDILAKELGISIDFIKIKYENLKKPTIFN